MIVVFSKGSRVWAAACGALLGVGLAGCGHTLNGARQDAAVDSQKATTATDQAAAQTGAAVRKAGAEVANAPRDIGEAAVLSPEVKTAIIRDPVLNDTKNLVDVSTKDGVVHLTGHVQTADMKRRATEDAQAVLSHHKGAQPVSNDLAVSAP